MSVCACQSSEDQRVYPARLRCDQMRPHPADSRPNAHPTGRAGPGRGGRDATHPDDVTPGSRRCRARPPARRHTPPLGGAANTGAAASDRPAPAGGEQAPLLPSKRRRCQHLFRADRDPAPSVDCSSLSVAHFHLAGQAGVPDYARSCCCAAVASLRPACYVSISVEILAAGARSRQSAPDSAVTRTHRTLLVKEPDVRASTPIAA